MTCETAIDLVMDALMDELDPGTARELAAHLDTCATCRTEAARLRDAWAALASVPVPAADPDLLIRFGRRLERQSRPAWRTAGLRAAGAAALLVVGALAGRALGGARTAPPVAADSAYLLLIRGDEPDRRVPEARLVAEYGAWARTLAAQDRLIGAEKLADDGGRWVGGDSAAPGARARTPISGFFLVRAGGYDEAVALARGHPHVAYGGIIEVREVDRR